VRVLVELLEQRGVPYVLLSPVGKAGQAPGRSHLARRLHHSPPVVQPRSAAGTDETEIPWS
jgi:hypothetical protein